MGWCARASSWEVQSKWLSPLLNVLKTASEPRVARPGWHVDLFISKAFAKQPSRTSRSASEAPIMPIPHGVHILYRLSRINYSRKEEIVFPL